ncbi:uncharacterized protein LOC114746038 [Neltuma alba]|uniref:uncharacterized protein LOC114746038 n=1 Tax=Neltuma alba TaxID=207710 RepID=UPI0010A4F794|nr:uncharacterized protein LOC114746038 [Prosopis alba]XP_028790058.1 uncharacterized protein LOC114746038 [Prosopis alba]XP_028790059.1 uncharacterized protein LOC114746038 [Prosopis alba]XP_028790060.1 uncharacterized protein LOC114746038 [Prosopis alba]XP_028790061.1 uncharacterized protein LOC114746038 [Prosopis alba]
MPKVRRVKSPSNECFRSSPYPCNSKNVEQHRAMNQLGSPENVKEWEEARCPICMEHPHNAVLLKCSSHKIGCRPYMCNTSHRHSNCLDQFCKSYDPHLSSSTLEEISLTSTASRGSCEVQAERCGNQPQPNLVCPLCRGEIYGYMVLEPARRYLNSKLRSCSSETCDFQGTYSELRKHARSEHPSVRPSEVDPIRQRDWTRMEQEWDLEDFLSSTQASFGTELRPDNFLTWDLSDMISMFLYDIFSTIEDFNRMTDLFNDSRLGAPVRDRRSGMMHTQRTRSARWRANLSSTQQEEINHRGRGRSNILSLRDREANRTARWRTSLLSSRMPRDLHQYCREVSPGTDMPSTRMPRSLSRITRGPSRRDNFSLRRRNPSGRHLRWRDQRWSMHNGLS